MGATVHHITDQHAEDRRRAADRAGNYTAAAAFVLAAATLVIIAWTVLDPATRNLGWSETQRTLFGVLLAIVVVVPTAMAAAGPVASTATRWYLKHR